jgi:hypothetical protein
VLFHLNFPHFVAFFCLVNFYIQPCYS